MVSYSLSVASFSLEVVCGSVDDSSNLFEYNWKEDEHNPGRLHDDRYLPFAPKLFILGMNSGLVE